MWVKSALEVQMMRIPLKTEMTGEGGVPLASRSGTASAFFRELPSPDMSQEEQKKSGDTVFSNKSLKLLTSSGLLMWVTLTWSEDLKYLMDSLHY